MFPKASVPLSKQAYQHYRPFMWFFRLVGLFPVTVQKVKLHYILHFSPLLIALGFVFGTWGIFMAYWGIYLDVAGNKEDSVRVASEVDRLMYVNDVNCYGLVFFCGVFLNPIRFYSFFTYVKRINRVDAVIGTSFNRWEKYKMIVVLSAIVALNTYLGWIDMRDSYHILGGKIGLAGVLERFIGIDAVAYTANIIEYTNQILLNGLEKRIRTFNQLLEIENDNIKKTRMIVARRPNTNIIKLSKAYFVLMDAADALNDFLGMATLGMVVAVLWGLIESSYFLLSVLAGKRGELRDAIEIPRCVSLLSFHVFRMLLITEPCYSCLVQMKETKRLICNLMSYNIGQRYRKQARRFAIMIELRQLEFSACGLLIIDRLLFTSLLDTIVTLLVILLQYRDELENEV